MNKTILRVISGAMIVAVLAGSSVAVAAADKKDKDQPQKTEQAADKAQRAAVQPKDQEQTRATAGDNIPKGQIQDRILQMRNEAKANEVLARLVTAGQITQQQADQIKAMWLKQHENQPPQNQPPYGQVLQRILDMRNPQNVQAVLARLVDAGKITAEECARIWDQWQKQHENNNGLPYGQVLQKILDMKNPDRVHAVLDRLVTTGKINQSDADKIWDQWQKKHTS